MEVGEAEIHPHTPKPAGDNGSDPTQQGCKASPAGGKGGRRALRPQKPLPQADGSLGQLGGGGGRGSSLGGEGENTTKSPDLPGSDPQGLTVNGDS